jgi:hypothetical protein
MRRRMDLGDFLEEEEEDEKMDLGDFLEVLVKEEEGEKEQETEVLTDSLEVKTEIELTDGLELLTAELASIKSIKSRLDGRQLPNWKDLVKFREILDEMIYQRVKRGTGGNNFWCRVASSKKMRRGLK